MELAYHLFVGAMAAVVAGLINTVAAPVYASLRAKARDAWRVQTLPSQLATLGIYVVAGAGLGLLFWLSWGLTAIVGVPWWQRGTAFALVLWCVGGLPILAMQSLALRLHWSVIAIIATEWLVTLTAVGLACSWSWAHAP